MKKGDIALFRKSGSIVELVSPCTSGRGKKWIVRRMDSGKELVAPERSLAPINPAKAPKGKNKRPATIPAPQEMHGPGHGQPREATDD